MVEGEQQGPVLVGTFFMVAEEYLPPTAAPGTWALMSPAQGRPPWMQIIQSVDAGLGSPRRAKMLRTESPWRTWAGYGGPGLHVRKAMPQGLQSPLRCGGT